jgi:hypothetical protein
MLSDVKKCFGAAYWTGAEGEVIFCGRRALSKTFLDNSCGAIRRPVSLRGIKPKRTALNARGRGFGVPKDQSPCHRTRSHPQHF